MHPDPHLRMEARPRWGSVPAVSHLNACCINVGGSAIIVGTHIRSSLPSLPWSWPLSLPNFLPAQGPRPQSRRPPAPYALSHIILFNFPEAVIIRPALLSPVLMRLGTSRKQGLPVAHNIANTKMNITRMAGNQQIFKEYMNEQVSRISMNRMLHQVKIP